jgi:BirA family biotin operon repressor/biotin-[acetyl-CoA-carboxylase] ligase
MDEHELRKTIADLPLGEVRFFDRTGSTNDVALAWATEGAPDLALVYAEEQTAGRGRGSHKWFTPPGAALAFSLVLRPASADGKHIARFSGLGALAVTEALGELKLVPEIKWPNDVLLRGRKVCGILVDVVWVGEEIESLVLGIGINVRPQSVPPVDQLNFPATSLEAETSQPIDRLKLLHHVLGALLRWRSRLPTHEFLQTWEDHLAYRGQQVEVWAEGMPFRPGLLEGLDEDGSLRLRTPQGRTFSLQFGEMHLRPVV